MATIHSCWCAVADRIDVEGEQQEKRTADLHRQAEQTVEFEDRVGILEQEALPLPIPLIGSCFSGPKGSKEVAER
jgi:hypothetical protein